MTIESLEQTTSIVVSAHRGYKSDYPENTLLAFAEALKLGVEMLEFDLHMTKDGTVVVIHDKTVDRTTNGTGAVSGFTLEEIKRLDAGSWFGKPFAGLQIPTLAELCDLLAEYPAVLLNVEVKSGPRAKEVADAAIAMLRQYNCLERCVFTCFDADIIAYFNDKHSVKTQGFPGDVMSNFQAGEQGTYSKMWAIGLEMSRMTPQIVKEYRAMGLQVWCYCPDTVQQVYYALGCGSTVMTCNNPLPALKLRELLIV
ncbi:glycerophosphodiester phosphodiesterase family protein [Paenibacillus sp. GCM10027626]|uniref:glycerophosphodiester phosphodiesterase family protein n=1 Tax=Paenibacillus sp. GCM10027626 TaxID=3273411 RepID=UPI0036308362